MKITTRMSKKDPKKWIQKIDMKKGAFTEQAKRAKKTVSQMIESVDKNPEKYSETTRRRAALAKTFKKMSKKK